MATQKVARGQITIVDLNDARSVNMFLSSNHPLTQIETSGTPAKYTPDYTVNNLVITPELLVSRGSAPTFTGAPTWKVNGNIIVAGDSNFVVANTAPFALTIKQNLNSVTQQYRIECIGTYADSPTGRQEDAVSVDIKSQITITRSLNTGELEFADISGGFFFRYGSDGPDPEYIDLTARLVRGSEFDETPTSSGQGDTSTFSVVWYRMVTQDTTDDTADGTTDGWQKITAAVKDPDDSTKNILVPNGNVLKVYPNAVNGSTRFKAEVKDTDSTSSGYNKTYIAEREIMDYSDPFMLRIDSSNGDVMKNGMGQTTLTAVLLSGGVPVGDNAYELTYAWTKYNANGTAETWNPSTGNKTSKTLTVTASDITQKATFACEVTIK